MHHPGRKFDKAHGRTKIEVTPTRISPFSPSREDVSLTCWEKCPVSNLLQPGSATLSAKGTLATPHE